MDKIPMNLEQTVQYLLDEVNKLKAGIAPGELIPGPQGVQGPEGQKPEVSISNATGNWVIDGVDTGKPSRGKPGEKGNTGMQGVPGVGVSTMLSIDSTEYTPTVTDDGAYQDVESSAEIKYSGDGVEHSTQVDFNIKVPKPDLSGKLDKVTTSGSFVRFYGVDGTGQQIMVESSAGSVIANAIVRRTAEGRVTAALPNSNSDVTNKEYVDNALSGKVDKTSYSNRVYATYADGDPALLSWSSNPNANTVAVRDTNGRLAVGSPADSNHAATKAYVDGNYQAKLYVHEGTVTIDGTDYRYRVLNKKSTAFTNPQTDFPEFGNLFALRTGPRLIFNLWYDDSDGTYYWSNINSSGSETSAYTVTILTDYVYAL